MYVSVKVTRHREDEMSADEIRLRIEGAKSPVARITVDLSSADARFIAPSGQATIWHGLRGVNKSVATAASSGLQAIRSAAEAICTGLAARVLAGGVQVISPEVLRGPTSRGCFAAGDITPAVRPGQ